MTTIIQRPTTADKVRPGDRIAVFGGEEMVVEGKSKIASSETGNKVKLYVNNHRVLVLDPDDTLYTYEYA